MKTVILVLAVMSFFIYVGAIKAMAQESTTVQIGLDQSAEESELLAASSSSLANEASQSVLQVQQRFARYEISQQDIAWLYSHLLEKENLDPEILKRMQESPRAQKKIFDTFEFVQGYEDAQQESADMSVVKKDLELLLCEKAIAMQQMKLDTALSQKRSLGHQLDLKNVEMKTLRVVDIRNRLGSLTIRVLFFASVVGNVWQLIDSFYKKDDC